MPIDVTIPAVGESITEGVLARWLVAEGDYVEMDQAIFELETDKISTEVPAEQAGVISFQAEEGDTVEIGQTVGSIDTDAAAPAAGPSSSTEPAPAAEPAAKAIDQDPPQRIVASGEADTSPAVRQLLADNKLEVGDVAGTGPGGRISKEDVLNHIAQKAKAPAPAAKPAAAASPAPAESGGVTRKRMSPLRARIAQRLVQAQRTAAILTTFNEIDMSACMAMRKKYKEAFAEKHQTGLGFMSFFVTAAVKALQAYPLINCQIDGTDIVEFADNNIGVAVGTEKGLVVPVLKGVQNMNFADIERGIRDFAKRARSGGLTMADMTGGTFTISNGGVYGSMMSTPILNPPQSGILGMHNITERPIAVNGEVVIRPMMYVALSYDHRIVDGAEAVGFLVKIKELIEAPERLIFDL